MKALKKWRWLAAMSIVFTGTAAAGEFYEPQTIHDVDVVGPTRLLVTDGGVKTSGEGGGVFLINPFGRILASRTEGLLWTHNADLIRGSLVLISDTNHDRCIVINAAGDTLWSTDDCVLSDGSRLDYPNDANLVLRDRVLITDRNNHRVLEIETDGAIVWQFGETGVSGNDDRHLWGPHNADRLADGNTLICDSRNNRILEVTPAGDIVWRYDRGLNWPRDADRLPNGNTLITDSMNNRILEVTPRKHLVWIYPHLNLPYDADRLENGATLISNDHEILLVSRWWRTLWRYPENQLNALSEFHP